MEKDQTVHERSASPVRLAFRVSYLGSRFFGSQIQAGCRTVEGDFIDSCQRLGLFSDREAGPFSGRTDRFMPRRVVAFSANSRSPSDLNLQPTGLLLLVIQICPGFTRVRCTIQNVPVLFPKAACGYHSNGAGFIVFSWLP
jgi:hypothetical protein